MQPYRPEWAFEEVLTVNAIDQLGMTYEQQIRAATVLYAWARVAGWAGLGTDLSNWPAGDPVRLLCHNIIERDTQHPPAAPMPRADQHNTTKDLPAVLYGMIAEWRIEKLPSPRQAEAIEHRLSQERSSTSMGQDDQDQVA